MKKIGIVGGMAPESTVEYYRIITTLARQGGATYRCPVIIIYSVNFEEFISLVQAGNLAAVTELLGDAIDRLSRAGADFALMASNTPHMVFDQVTARLEESSGRRACRTTATSSDSCALVRESQTYACSCA